MGRIVDLVGQRFGRLQVKSLFGTSPTRWNTVCDCGKEKVVSSDNLRSGKSRSCGCLRIEVACRQLGVEPTGRPPVPHRIFDKYRYNARQRGLVWGLTFEQVEAVISQPCHYCGAKEGYNGIDRKDSSVGYFPENVVPCCKSCNRIKGREPYASFMSFIQRVAEFRGVAS